MKGKSNNIFHKSFLYVGVLLQIIIMKKNHQAFALLLEDNSPIRTSGIGLDEFFSIFTSTSTFDDVKYKNRRSLFGFGNAVCSLTAQSFQFDKDPITGLYDYNPGSNVTTTLAGEDAGFTSNNDNNDSDDDDDYSSIIVRVCWCTQFFERDYEFCPAEFDSCLVQGRSGTVSCYRTEPVDTFVRSFWPVAIFWGLALLYALFCSEAGRQARQYARRKFRMNNICCNPHERPNNNNDDENNDPAVQELNRMLQQEPERAAYIYRLYVRRLHRRSRPSNSWWRRILFFRSNNNRRNNNNNSQGNNNNNNGESNLDPALCDRLALRTKVFHDAETGGEDAATTTAATTTTASTTTATETNNNGTTNNTNTTSNGGNTGWTLPFHRPENQDQATLEEMDDELEHGTRCAICLLRLEEGDVIGDIPCGHTLHKDCLKDWLRRKNRCPLCQQAGIARLFPPESDDQQNR